MKTIKLFQVDTLTDKVFYGARTTICVLDEWLNDELMLIIARENKSFETSFIHYAEGNVTVRCFSAAGEITLTGHACLAIAYILYKENIIANDNIKLWLNDHQINVFKNNSMICAELPEIIFEKTSNYSIARHFGIEEFEIYESNNSYFVILSDASKLNNISITFTSINNLDKKNIIFSGVAQDGSIHASCYGQNILNPEMTINYQDYRVLTEIWSKKIGENYIRLIHRSKNKELFNCELDSKKNLILGSCRLYFQGELFL